MHPTWVTCGMFVEAASICCASAMLAFLSSDLGVMLIFSLIMDLERTKSFQVMGRKSTCVPPLLLQMFALCFRGHSG